MFLIYKADVFIVRLFGGCITCYNRVYNYVVFCRLQCCLQRPCVRARSVDNNAPLRLTRAGRFAPICRRTVADAVCNSF